jgi:hypothetical protein
LRHAAYRHQIFNLDGLMNDVDYCERYLTRGWEVGLPAYLGDENIPYFADYAPNHGWRDGWQRKSLELLRWWPMNSFGSPAGQYDSYAIWRRTPDGTLADPPAPCAAPCNQLERLQFAAEVLGRHCVVGEDELFAAAAAPADHPRRVVTSIIAPSTGELRHVLMPIDEAAALHFSPEQIGLTVERRIVFGAALELLGADVYQLQAQPGQRLVWTLYWRKRTADRDLAGVRLETWLNPADPAALAGTPPAQRFWHSSAGCHGTYPPAAWSLGEIVVETQSVCVPASLRPGTYPLRVGVWHPRDGWLSPASADLPGAQSLVWVGSVEVR